MRDVDSAKPHGRIYADLFYSNAAMMREAESVEEMIASLCSIESKRVRLRGTKYCWRCARSHER
jgi:hypothetical protein